MTVNFTAKGRGRIEGRPFVLGSACHRVELDYQRESSGQPVQYGVDTYNFLRTPLTVFTELAERLSANRGGSIDVADLVTNFRELPAVYKLLIDDEYRLSVSEKLPLARFCGMIGLNEDDLIQLKNSVRILDRDNNILWTGEGDATFLSWFVPSLIIRSQYARVTVSVATIESELVTPTILPANDAFDNEGERACARFALEVKSAVSRSRASIQDLDC